MIFNLFKNDSAVFGAAGFFDVRSVLASNYYLTSDYLDTWIYSYINCNPLWWSRLFWDMKKCRVQVTGGMHIDHFEPHGASPDENTYYDLDVSFDDIFENEVVRSFGVGAGTPVCQGFSITTGSIGNVIITSSIDGIISTTPFGGISVAVQSDAFVKDGSDQNLAVPLGFSDSSGLVFSSTPISNLDDPTIYYPAMDSYLPITIVFCGRTFNAGIQYSSDLLNPGTTLPAGETATFTSDLAIEITPTEWYSGGSIGPAFS